MAHAWLILLYFTAGTDWRPETTRTESLRPSNPGDVVRGYWRTAAAVRSLLQPRQGLGQSPPRSIADSTMEHPTDNMQRVTLYVDCVVSLAVCVSKHECPAVLAW